MINDLGSLYANQDELNREEEMYRWVLEGRKQAVEPDHLSTLDVVSCLGMPSATQGRLDEAEQIYKRALAGYKKLFESNHMFFRSLRCTLATIKEHAAT